ncbi:hypothetical protein [Paracoccus endophyticus]|uniref:hypothetical protein n=1 Tax=Paracoccus endophyticus TaxID=2233774 RepID=UPI0013A68DE7|nr:hypothetical protein [Paracoccus endophyticus]
MERLKAAPLSPQAQDAEALVPAVLDKDACRGADIGDGHGLQFSSKTLLGAGQPILFNVSKRKTILPRAFSSGCVPYPPPREDGP